jgi:hypothetical protein
VCIKVGSQTAEQNMIGFLKWCIIIFWRITWCKKMHSRLNEIIFIYIWSKLVFESLAHKIDIHLCLYYSLTTNLVFVSLFWILFCIKHNCRNVPVFICYAVVQ